MTLLNKSNKLVTVKWLTRIAFHVGQRSRTCSTVSWVSGHGIILLDKANLSYLSSSDKRIWILKLLMGDLVRVSKIVYRYCRYQWIESKTFIATQPINWYLAFLPSYNMNDYRLQAVSPTRSLQINELLTLRTIINSPSLFITTTLSIWIIRN